MHKKEDLNKKGEFENLPDGEYPAVLENCKLDLENKYGARLNMTFKFPNKRLAWIDLRENKKGELNGAWVTLKKLGVGREVSDALAGEFDTKTFLETALKHVEECEGNYYWLEGKTFETQNGPKQYWSVQDACEETEYDNYDMPKPGVKKNVTEIDAPSLDTNEEIPF